MHMPYSGQVTAQTKTDFVDYIDKHIQATLPNKHSNKELHDLVWTYQKHSHSKTCRKYKNLQCRFHFEQFFTERTIVAEPLPENLTSEEKLNILTNREQILKKVKSKIDEALDPSKPAYNPNHSILEILAMINVTERDNYNAFSISPDSDFRLYLKRSPDSCFINNYFIPGILALNANIDVQPVFNYVRCIAYMCSYFSKDETKCSQALQSAALEARNTNSPVRETLKKVGAAFLTKREISAQKCVYRCLPELWMRKIFPGTLFLNTDLPDSRLRMRKSERDLEELDDDSTDIYKHNILDRYIDRPVSVNSLCFAVFASLYYSSQKYPTDVETNDAQPSFLTDQSVESNNENLDSESLPLKIILQQSKHIMRKCKVRAVLRFYRPNQSKYPGKYAHLLMYYPSRNEADLCAPDGTYASKLLDDNVSLTIQTNKSFIEPHSDEVNNAELFISERMMEPSYIFDPIGQQENAEISSQMSSVDTEEEVAPIPFSENSFDRSTSSQNIPIPSLTTVPQPQEIGQDDLHKMIRSLNTKQRIAFETILKWCRQNIHSQPSTPPCDNSKPPQLFITGGAGAGKSHLIKTIYQTSCKIFKEGNESPEKPSVLLLAPTGVSAIMFREQQYIQVFPFQ